jgi:hypothetical protein
MRPELVFAGPPYPSVRTQRWIHVWAVFLRSPIDGLLNVMRMKYLLQLPNVCAVGRRLSYLDLYDAKSYAVEQTVDLRSCPGVLVLRHSDEKVLEADLLTIRAAEAEDLYLPRESPRSTDPTRTESDDEDVA